MDQLGINEVSRDLVELLLPIPGGVNAYLFSLTSNVDPVCNQIAPHCSKETFLISSPFQFFIFLAISQSFMPLLAANLPETTSVKTLLHYGQLVRNNRFAQFDNGEEGNVNAYGTAQQPDYDLTNTATPTALYYSDSDTFAAVKDVARLHEDLPNVIAYHRVDDDTFQHYDYTFAPDAKSLVYDYVIEAMRNIENDVQ